jgi:hypothetical protein
MHPKFCTWPTCLGDIHSPAPAVLLGAASCVNAAAGGSACRYCGCCRVATCIRCLVSELRGTPKVGRSALAQQEGMQAAPLIFMSRISRGTYEHALASAVPSSCLHHAGHDASSCFNNLQSAWHGALTSSCTCSSGYGASSHQMGRHALGLFHIFCGASWR